MAAFALFLLLAVAWTHPLVFDLTASFPGTEADADVVTFIWNFWWMKHALVELGTNPFVCDYVLAPHAVDLRLHTFAPLHGFLSIPIQAILGPVGAFNVFLLLTMAANGYATYVLAFRLWKKRDVAFLAGALVAFSPAVTFFVATGRPSFASVWLLAVATILVDRGGRKDAVALGVVGLAALLTDFQMLMFVVLWVLAYATLARRLRWNLSLSAIIVAVPFVLFFLPPLLDASYPAPSLEDSLQYSLQAQNFVHPPTLRFLLGWALPLAVAVACVVVRRADSVRVWLVLGGAFVVLSLGARLQPTSLPLPFALLREIPGLDQFRTPYRFTVPAALALALAGAAAGDYLRQKWNRYVIAGAIALTLWDGFTAEPQRHPFEVQAYPDEPVYERIAADARDVTVLQVPLGIRSGIDAFGNQETLQFHQMVHAKRGVNAMIARVPAETFAHYRASPALRLLAGEPVAGPSNLQANLEKTLRELDVGYVVVHKKWVEPERRLRIEALLDRLSVATELTDSDTVRAFRIDANR